MICSFLVFDFEFILSTGLILCFGELVFDDDSFMVIVDLFFLVHSFVNVLFSCAEIVIKKIDSFLIFLSQIKLPVEIHRHQLAQIHDRKPYQS